MAAEDDPEREPRVCAHRLHRLRRLRWERPEAVLSGVNLGANTGHATLHSGTVGAALSAATQGIPGLAVSMASARPRHWATAEVVCRVALDWLVEHGPRRRVLNVNVPDVPPDELKGLRPARLAEFGAVQAAVKERGRGWVAMTYQEVDVDHEPGTDAYLLERGWATASLLRTPIHDVRRPEPPRFTTAAGRAHAEDGDDEVVDVSAGRTMPGPVS